MDITAYAVVLAWSTYNTMQSMEIIYAYGIQRVRDGLISPYVSVVQNLQQECENYQDLTTWFWRALFPLLPLLFSETRQLFCPPLPGVPGDDGLMGCSGKNGVIPYIASLTLNVLGSLLTLHLLETQIFSEITWLSLTARGSRSTHCKNSLVRVKIFLLTVDP